MLLGIDQIRTDGGTQTRAGLNDAAIKEYAEAMSGDASFPPLVVFYDGQAHWLADGFHRLGAYRRFGAQAVPVEVRQGTRRDAILFSVCANATNGLPRTEADKRRAIEVLLRDEEWGRRSDRWIGRRAVVDHKTVAAIRRQLGKFPSCQAKSAKSQEPPRREGQDGRWRAPPKPATASSRETAPDDADPTPTGSDPRPLNDPGPRFASKAERDIVVVAEQVIERQARLLPTSALPAMRTSIVGLLDHILEARGAT